MLFLMRSWVRPDTEFSAFLYQKAARFFSCWRAMPCSFSPRPHQSAPNLTWSSPLLGRAISFLSGGAVSGSSLFSNIGRPLIQLPLIEQRYLPQVRLALLSSGLLSSVSRAPLAASNSFS